jgi:hypothetical protein
LPSGHDALVDRLAQIDIGVWPGRSHVAARRETGRQRDQGVVRAVQRRLPGRRLQQLVFPVHAGAGEMGVKIDQPRQQRRRTKIDHARVGRNAAAHRHDSIAADDDHRRCDDAVVHGGDHPRRTDHNRGRNRRLRAESDEGSGGDQHTLHCGSPQHLSMRNSELRIENS